MTTPVFGLPLGRAVPPGASVPTVVEHCINFLSMANPVTEPTLFDATPTTDPEVQDLRTLFDSYTPADPADPTADSPAATASSPSTIASLLILYFKSLPHPIVPPKLYITFLRLAVVNPLRWRLAQYRVMVAKLPAVCRNILHLLLPYLHDTELPADKLGAMFARYILRPSNDHIAESQPSPASAVRLVTQLIEQSPFITLATDEPNLTPEELAVPLPNERLKIEAKVLYDYIPPEGAEGMLVLQKDERVKLMGAFPDDWLEGQIEDRVGFIPAAYVEIIPANIAGAAAPRPAVTPVAVASPPVQQAKPVAQQPAAVQQAKPVAAPVAAKPATPIAVTQQPPAAPAATGAGSPTTPSKMSIVWPPPPPSGSSVSSPPPQQQQQQSTVTLAPPPPPPVADVPPPPPPAAAFIPPPAAGGDVPPPAALPSSRPQPKIIMPMPSAMAMANIAPPPPPPGGIPPPAIPPPTTTAAAKPAMKPILPPPSAATSLPPIVAMPAITAIKKNVDSEDLSAEKGDTDYGNKDSNATTTTAKPPTAGGKRKGDCGNEFKIVVVGSGGVGKSAITISFVQNHFVEEYDPTIEDSYRKQITVDEIPCFLNILDTAGQEEYSAMRDQYMKTGQGFLLVFSLTTRSTFDEVSELRNRILQAKDRDQVPIVLVGNKSDLVKEHQVSLKEAADLGRTFACPFLATSAKLRINVEECFTELVREVRKDTKNISTRKGGVCSLL